MSMRYENNVSTLEGFSIKNLKRFPSSEWGDMGGVDVDVYYKGKKIMNVFNAGDGGMSKVAATDLFYLTADELKANALKLLKRLEPCYSTLPFLASKEAKDINEDDWLAVAEHIALGISDYAYVVASLKKGYATIAFLENEDKTRKSRFRSKSRLDSFKIRDIVSQNPRFANFANCKSMKVAYGLDDVSITKI